MNDARRFLGEILVDMGCVTHEDIDVALELQMKGDTRKIGEIFQAQELCDAAMITGALAEQFEMELVDLDGLEPAPDAIRQLDENTCRENHVFPVELSEDNLTLAISDPLDLHAVDSIRFSTNLRIHAVLAPREAIDAAIARQYGGRETYQDVLRNLSSGDIQVVNTDRIRDENDRPQEDEAPVVKLVELIIRDAVRSRASDIHIEPMLERLRVRYRIDGVCYEIDAPARRLQGSIISRLKILANMHVEEKRRPQDGKIKLRVQGRELDLRVNTLPATHGESVVLRILDKNAIGFGLEELGFYDDDTIIFRNLLKKPNGVLLITGPTGSGKTTTLYAALSELNKPDRKIITAENPVEYTVSGLNQCQIDPEAGLTFPRVLRAMLRQAPNVILVGEIRDKETSETAVQAALTGHLVFSTLHTNDAPGALTRLIDMGVAPFLVASSVQAVQAQRLIRTLCPNCKESFEEDPARLRAAGLRDEQFAARPLYHGPGCTHCNHVGFKGRKGIYEIMVMNSRLRELCYNKATTDALRDQARRDGMHTLLEDGLRKVLDGWTTLDEVLGEAKQYG